MTGLIRLLALLALAVAFLLASFLGGMTHSIVAEFVRNGLPWWTGVAGAIVIGGAWAAYRAVRRRAGGTGSNPPPG